MMERKIHRNLMTQDELDRCEALVKRVPGSQWLLIKHVRERVEEKGIEWVWIARTLLAFDVIEYKITKRGTQRVVIRSREVFGRGNVVLVLEPERRTLITAWLNAASDTHRSLDLSMYDATLAVR